MLTQRTTTVTNDTLTFTQSGVYMVTLQGYFTGATTNTLVITNAGTSAFTFLPTALTALTGILTQAFSTTQIATVRAGQTLIIAINGTTTTTTVTLGKLNILRLS